MSSATDVGTSGAVGKRMVVDQDADDTTKLRDYFDHQPYQEDELFAEEQGTKPWWKSSFLLKPPTLFGTWDGVFTSCLINILGVIIFLRSGWIVGQAGIWMSTLIVFISVAVILTSVLSAIGICEMSHVDSGGVYSVLSNTLGSRVGGAFGILYCFGNAVEGALHAAGFGESIAELFKIEDPWMERLFGIALIVALVLINVAGVQWVVKLQFFLLLALLLATCDFVLGSVLKTDFDAGVVGWSKEAFMNNTSPSYTDNNDWFSVFGVFFPTVTGILAGLNMFGDLKNPKKDIPLGTLSAVGFSSFIYLLFLWILAFTCQRDSLRTNFLIVEKTSFVGFLVLFGLYVSSVSTCLGVLYGTPRVLQSIASQKIIPVLQPLEKGRGPNKVPVLSVIVVGLVTLIFVLVGQINRLAPIVTLPFLLTYAAIDYAHFALCQARCINMASGKSLGDDGRQVDGKQGLESPTFIQSPAEKASPGGTQGEEAAGTMMGFGAMFGEITSQPKSWYSWLCNRYVSLAACVLKIVMVLLVHWLYGLAFLAILGTLYLYIGRSSQVYSPGLAHDFSFFEWLFDVIFSPTSATDSGTPFWRRLKFFDSRRKEYEEVVVGPSVPTTGLYKTEQSQLTDPTTDFSWRKPYHQSAAMGDVGGHAGIGDESTQGRNA